jgi:hypothetical protein
MPRKNALPQQYDLVHDVYPMSDAPTDGTRINIILDNSYDPAIWGDIVRGVYYNNDVNGWIWEKMGWYWETEKLMGFLKKVR